MIELRDVSCGYGGKPVLVHVNLSLEPGQRLALMGASGVGKTTLLRMVLGLGTPDAGAVTNTFQRAAAVFQEPRLLPWRTAVENVNLALGDKKETLARSERQLERLGLGDALDKYPDELSGGMQQRVALARALAVEGDLLVLDEPFKALDPQLRQQVMDQVSQTKAAILLVTHDAEEARALGCRIVEMETPEQK